jgi:hypothetical protein
MHKEIWRPPFIAHLEKFSCSHEQKKDSQVISRISLARKKTGGPMLARVLEKRTKEFRCRT